MFPSLNTNYENIDKFLINLKYEDAKALDRILKSKAITGNTEVVYGFNDSAYETNILEWIY